MVWIITTVSIACALLGCVWLLSKSAPIAEWSAPCDAEGLRTCVVIDLYELDTTAVMDAERLDLTTLASHLGRRGIPANRLSGEDIIRVTHEERIYLLKALQCDEATWVLRVDLESGESPPDDPNSLEVLGTLHYILRTLDTVEFEWFKREDIIDREDPARTPY